MYCFNCDVDIDEFDSGWEYVENAGDNLCTKCINKKIDSGELERLQDGGLVEKQKK